MPPGRSPEGGVGLKEEAKLELQQLRERLSQIRGRMNQAVDTWEVVKDKFGARAEGIKAEIDEWKAIFDANVLDLSADNMSQAEQGGIEDHLDTAERLLSLIEAEAAPAPAPVAPPPPEAAPAPEPGPAAAEAPDPLAEEMLALMQEDEETQKTSQAVAGAYNQAVKYEGFRSIFRQKYSPVRFGVQNVDTRLRNASVPPEFKTATDGDLLAVPIKGQANRYVVVPRLDITIQEHNFNPGGMVLVYDMPGYDARQRYNNVEVVKPAVFELDGTTWRCVVKGELNLTPGPATAEAPSALEKPIDFGAAKEIVRQPVEPPAAEKGGQERITEIKGQMAEIMKQALVAMRTGDKARIRALRQQHDALEKGLKTIQ